MNINRNNSKSKSPLAWPLLAIGTTALVMSAIGVNAQNQTATSSLPLPPRITAEAPPLPEDGPPAPPHDGGPDSRGPERDGSGRRGMRPGRGDGPDGGPGAAGMHPGGPEDGPGRGPRRGGPRPAPQDANTPEGSARSLERAYRTAGEIGNVDGEAREVSTQARALYSQALVAYNAKDYTKAFQLAEGSERLSRTADALDHAGDTSLPKVAGLTPPPVVKKDKDDAESVSDRAAHDLNRAYHETDRAKEFDTPFSKQWSAKAESNYRAALTAYNDKRYDEAARRARLSAEQGKVAREYGETMKS